MTKNEQSRRRLEYWQSVVDRDETAWELERGKMDWREELYRGTKTLMPTVKAEEGKSDLRCFHVRNVIAENVETMVDTRVPKPKVTPLRKENEKLARTLEHLLSFWVRRKHVRILNDLAERMVPIQGACAWLIEWDNTLSTSDTNGDVEITLLHPKQLVPQAGIYSDVRDMDHVCVKLALTRQQVRARFGVDVPDASETEPELRGLDGESANEDDLLTAYMLYYRNEHDGIGLLAWYDDTVLADREDYQARSLRRCRQCGALDSYVEPAGDSEREELESSGQDAAGPHRCEWCEGTAFEEVTVDREAVMQPTVLLTSLGKEISLDPPIATTDEQGRLHLQARSFLPYYRPKLLPIVLQKNISVFGRLLGESDVDKMADQQNTIKRLDMKMLDRIVKAGTKIGLPPDVTIQTTTEDQEVIRLENPAQAQMIKTYEFTGDISPEKLISDRVYEEARQGAGITDSLQGRRDPTATSGVAKEYAAGRSEGRMESRRVMKQEAWSKIYETVAKMFLAYADEPRRIRIESADGQIEYEQFDRRDFLQQDDKGQIYYEDGFIFETDNATQLGENRESMWQELTQAFATGTLGAPTDPQTLALYWGLMEEQGYPGAGAIRKKMEQRAELAAQTPQAPVVSGSDTLPGAAGMAQ